MMPEFNVEGNLPEGVHPATTNEFFARFGKGSARREWLAGRLRMILNLATRTGHLERVFVWGSFVTATESPNDIDLLLVMEPELKLDELPDQARVLFDHAAAKLNFQADVFWTKSSIGADILRLWLDTYQTGRDFKRRGIVELKVL